ncbi:hypothetical protein SAMN06265349_10447 [Flavobacterium resistens]|uniref:Uncharacterized protein n=1 Tax=Flavobacterium resistens TaxID=443612 RepID=A0A521E2V1_9FLAO|nr:hypothetical protein [Flavobacterium resistens]MRX69266.1 hypothetical protein [Flavobacterium resistens]SMO78286.1 hypothetical protein SAMN06265349_10447 [Flavobacterium resistens]
MDSITLKEKFLRKAVLVTKIINYTSAGIIVWILKFPTFYNYMVIVCFLMPIIGILLFRLSKGIIKIEAKRNSSTNVLAAFFPPIFLAFRIHSDFNIVNYSNVWFSVAIMTILFSAIFLIVNRKYLQIENWYRTILRIVLFSFIYVFGVVIGFNCVFDKSKPQIFTSTVNHMRIQSVGIKSYDIEVISEEKQSEAIKLTIDKNTYNELEVGRNVTIYVFKGLFNISWVEAGR